MIRIVSSIGLLAFALSANAQNEADVLRYSRKYFQGTARSIGLGGAMGALGGDMSAIHQNPAGIGVYRFGDISFTPGFESNEIASNINGDQNFQSINKVVINNAGFVLSNELKNPYWKAINFGVSYNRVNTFNDKLLINTRNPFDRSLQQDFVNEAQGVSLGDISDFSAGLAYDTFIIDTPDSLNPSTYVGRISEGIIDQKQIAERSGRLSETSLTVGTNYNDVLYLGAALGFQSVAYKQKIETTESPQDPGITDLIQYKFRENLEIEGIGVNFKIGAMAKAGKYLRLGAAIHTPTAISLTDNFRNDIAAIYRQTATNPAETLTGQSPVGSFDYRIITPWRYMASIAGIMGKKAVISFQYEFSNFSKGRLKNSNSSGSDEDFSSVNELVASAFTSSNVYRVGGEFRFTKSFYGRAGFAYFTNPNKANEFTSANLDRRQYSGGLGYRAAKWNIDLSYQLAQFDELYQANFAGSVGTLENNLQTFALTVGLRL